MGVSQVVNYPKRDLILAYYIKNNFESIAPALILSVYNLRLDPNSIILSIDTRYNLIYNNNFFGNNLIFGLANKKQSNL